MTNRRVFILNDGGHDYSDAAAFGEIVICSTGVLLRNDISYMYRLLNPFLDEADRNDIIVVNGLASLVGVASAIMAANHGEVHFLVFVNGKYVIKDLML